jgi:DUF971 family protein
VTPFPDADPRSVQVNLTSGTTMEIDWKDGHHSSYPFPFLRDACPCALCDEERAQQHREPGDPPPPSPDALQMFKAAARPKEAAGVGKYAIRFVWNDGHEHGIYSWDFLREFCPCDDCTQRRRAAKPPGSPVTRTTPHGRM